MSIQSLGLACITCAIGIKPTSLRSLESITTFVDAPDPKLRSNVAKVSSMIYSNCIVLCDGNQVISLSVSKLHVTELNFFY